MTDHGTCEGKLSLNEWKEVLWFDFIEEFVYWYNYVKPHMSLNFEELETPYQAFLRGLPAERVMEYGRLIE